VELALAQGQVQQAQALLALAAPTTAMARRTDMLLGARVALLRATQRATPDAGLATVAQGLQTWVADHGRDAQAWQELASVYELQGRTLQAIRAQGEARAAQLDFTGALARFKAAQDWARKNAATVDHFEASIVDTRARAIESTVREQAQER